MQKTIILVDEKQRATILTALNLYSHEGLGVDPDVDMTTLDEKGIDALVADIKAQSSDRHGEILSSMKNDGMSFHECVNAYAVDEEDPFVASARETCNDDLQIDSRTITSVADEGAWVMCWVWVSNNDAGIAKGETTPPKPTAKLSASHYLNSVALMSTDDLDDWYEEHVGYRISQEDPGLIGSPKHGYAVAEMMCLHAHGDGDVYQALHSMIKEASRV